METIPPNIGGVWELKSPDMALVIGLKLRVLERIVQESSAHAWTILSDTIFPMAIIATGCEWHSAARTNRALRGNLKKFFRSGQI